MSETRFTLEWIQGKIQKELPEFDVIFDLYNNTFFRIQYKHSDPTELNNNNKIFRLKLYAYGKHYQYLIPVMVIGTDTAPERMNGISPPEGTERLVTNYSDNNLDFLLDNSRINERLLVKFAVGYVKGFVRNYRK